MFGSILSYGNRLAKRRNPSYRGAPVLDSETSCTVRSGQRGNKALAQQDFVGGYFRGPRRSSL